MTAKRQQENLNSLVRTVWRRAQCLHFSGGVLALCRWAIPIFLAGMAIDWLTHLPAPGRAANLVILIVVSLIKGWRHGWQRTRVFDATHTALQIEDHHGGLESLLASAVQLGDVQPSRGTSDSLSDVTCRRAEEAAAQLRAEKIVGFHGLHRPATVALLLAATIGIFAVVNGPFLAVGAARIFAPWLEVEYPTRTHLKLVEGDLVVKEGDIARIEARISGVVPSQAQLELRTGEGSPRVLPLDVINGVCEYTIASAFRGFKYRVSAGDARSPWHQVQVIPAPRVERLEVGLEFPSYIERPTETVEALTFTVPEGTRIKWQLTLDRPISKAEVNIDGEEPQPLEVNADGRRVTMGQIATASRAYSFSWVEKEHGFSFTSPRHYLQVAPDQPPHVELSSPAGNLNAMLGRPVDLVVRARDDHGIGTATVAYRVNHTPEETFRLAAPILNGGGEQPIDWDYRKVLPDLNIGDSVTFAVEVSDRYPGPEGTHRARSETRRVSFLSRDEYLKQIEKQKNRLLSLVRAIYRQERAAYELVRRLDPGDDVFVQTCQLEAIRQEMLRERLNLTAKMVEDLLTDLAANNVADAMEGESLARVRSGLQTIAKTHVARAASMLRARVDVNREDASRAPAAVAHFINTAARELGSLVLERGIDSAQEVFARELHVFAQAQSSLRLQSIETRLDAAVDEVGSLSKRQEELAQWTARLLSDLLKGMKYTRRPLAVLRLTRLIKKLQKVGTEAKMLEAAALIRKGQPDPAAGLQTAIIRALLGVELRIRVGAEFETLHSARDLFVSLVNDQKKLRVESEAMTPEQFNKNRPSLELAQTAHRKKLLLLLLPSIPAPRPHLFDADPPQPPPVDDLLTSAERAMAKAVGHIKAGEREAVAARQQEAEKSLAILAGIVSQRTEELVLQTEGAIRQVAAAGDRVTRLGDYETQQISLLEQTEDAEDDGTNCASLAGVQQSLVKDVEEFRKELASRKDPLAAPGKEVLPLLSRLDQAVQVMKNAVPALKANRPGEAIKHQEMAADTLAGASEFTQTVAARLEVFHGLLLFRSGVRHASGALADITSEQRDLIPATKDAKPGDLPALARMQKNLAKAVVEVAPVLDLVAPRMDVGTPLLFAGSDMEDSVGLLEEKNKDEALDAQSVAAEALEEVQAHVEAVAPQSSYLAEIVEFLNGILPDATFIAFRLEQLRKEITADRESKPQALVEDQRKLQLEAENFGHLLQRATGMPRYSQPAQHITGALERMNASNPSASVGQMKLAEGTLNDHATELFNLMRMLRDLPGIAVMDDSPKELLLLLDVLAVASEQKVLYRKTQLAALEETASLAPKQSDLEARCKAFIESDQPHPKLVAAYRHLSEASSALKPSSQADAIRNQQAAGELLRHFIVEQALVMATPPPGPEDPLPGGEIYIPGPDMLIDFASDVVSGELPKDKRVEWEVLGRRTRAALNENFARELPLEYRGLLKNYYERVAK